MSSTEYEMQLIVQEQCVRLRPPRIDEASRPKVGTRLTALAIH